MQTIQRLTERIYSGFEVRDHARVHVGDNYFQSKYRNQLVPDQSNESEALDQTVKQPAEPAPLFEVPFSRDPDYIHRGVLVDELYKKLSVPAARVALVGLGGIG
jgi:hypothetical protein